MNGCLSVVRHITELANGGVKTISTIEGGGGANVNREDGNSSRLPDRRDALGLFPGW